ncbi:MAG: hypothetical protein LBL35_06340 [Clostridiales bacterium]|jgi:hypothetical protein|nr:hypothetical protein [Clostridiales bacterium]
MNEKTRLKESELQTIENAEIPKKETTKLKKETESEKQNAHERKMDVFNRNAGVVTLWGILFVMSAVAIMRMVILEDEDVAKDLVECLKSFGLIILGYIFNNMRK